MLKSDVSLGQMVMVTAGYLKGEKGKVLYKNNTHAYVGFTDPNGDALVKALYYEALKPCITSPPIVTSDANHTDKCKAEHYDEHYASMVGLEPIELMQLMLSLPEFVGFLKGNIIKYTLRAGKKQGEAAEKDAAKAKRYTEWLVKLGYKMPINPKED